MKKKILAGISVITLGLITSAIYDSVKSIPIWTTLLNILDWIWIIIFCAEFTVWQIILGLVILIIIYSISSKIRSVNIKEPDFISYVSEMIDDYTWTWSWIWSNSNNSWVINNLRPECPRCKTVMHYELDYDLGLYEANCPRCDYYVVKIKPYKDVEAIILDNIRKKREINE